MENRMCMLVCGELESEAIEKALGVRVMPMRLLGMEENMKELVVSIPVEDCKFFEMVEDNE